MPDENVPLPLLFTFATIAWVAYGYMLWRGRKTTNERSEQR